MMEQHSDSLLVALRVWQTEAGGSGGLRAAAGVDRGTGMWGQ